MTSKKPHDKKTSPEELTDEELEGVEGAAGRLNVTNTELGPNGEVNLGLLISNVGSTGPVESEFPKKRG